MMANKKERKGVPPSERIVVSEVDHQLLDEEFAATHAAIARQASKPDPRPIDPFAPGTIVSFFDVNNIDHLKAWKWLEEQGFWPEYFQKLSKNCTMPSMWHTCIRSKLADAWISHKLNDDSVWSSGIPEENLK